MGMYQRDQLLADLRQNVMEVFFTKTNGETRRMRCTLQAKYIPEDQKPKGTDKTENKDVIAVFDMQANGWRSFRVDSVFMVQGVNAI